MILWKIFMYLKIIRIIFYIDNMNKIKNIKPNYKKEFESILYNFYSEIKKYIEKSDDLNKDNNLSQRLLNQEGQINPIFILNDDQIK